MPIPSRLARGLYLPSSKSRTSQLRPLDVTRATSLFLLTRLKPPKLSANCFNLQRRHRRTRCSIQFLRRIRTARISNPSKDATKRKKSSCANSRSWTPQCMVTSVERSWISSVGKCYNWYPKNTLSSNWFTHKAYQHG